MPPAMPESLRRGRSVGDLTGGDRLPLFVVWCLKRSRGLINQGPPTGVSVASGEAGLGTPGGRFGFGEASFVS